MDEPEFQRGVRDAQADITNDCCRLFFQTRGSWGERFTDLMRDRFNVQVVHVSDITWDSKRSYEHGYNSTITSFLEGKYGPGAYEHTWEEIQEYRRETYRKWLSSQSDA